jgi:hypothetical protein
MTVGGNFKTIDEFYSSLLEFDIDSMQMIKILSYFYDLEYELYQHFPSRARRTSESYPFSLFAY